MHPLSYGSIFGNLQQCKTFSTYDKDCEKVIKFCQSGEISPYLVTFLLKDASFSIPDLYAQPHPMPATSPHQVSKISAAAYSTYAPPPQVHHTGVATHQVTYAYQTPPPPAGSQQHPVQPVQKIPMTGQLIYAGEFYPAQQSSTVSYAPQALDMTGGLGPQRGAMFTQPSQPGYHPYRRS